MIHLIDIMSVTPNLKQQHFAVRPGFDGWGFRCQWLRNKPSLKWVGVPRAVGNDPLGVQRRAMVANSLEIGVKSDDRFARSSLALICSWRLVFHIPRSDPI